MTKQWGGMFGGVQMQHIMCLKSNVVELSIKTEVEDENHDEY